MPRLMVAKQTISSAHRTPVGGAGAMIVALLCCVAVAGCRSPSSRLASSLIRPNSTRIGTLAVGRPVLSRLPPLDQEAFARRQQSPRSATAIQLVSHDSEEPVDAALVLGLHEAIEISLERNPDLAAVRTGEPVAHAAYHVAETYPWNPQFQMQVLPYSRDRDGNDGAISQQYVVVQTIELGGKRRYRRAVAAASWDQVTLTIRQAELMNAAQTMRLFFAALYQRELSDMNRELARLNEHMVGVIGRRMKAGQANPADVDLARLQARSSRRQQRLSEANYRAALMALRNQLNLEEDVSLDLTANWLDWHWKPLQEALSMGSPTNTVVPRHGPLDATALRRLIVDRPDVAAARAGAGMAAENLGLANAMRRPDMQLGPMWQLDDSSTEFWGVQGQIDIPVVNTGKPLVAQRMAELRQQETTAAQLENRAVLEARAAIQRYERARRLVEESRQDFATIDDTLKPFDEQFKAGQITLLQVFAARTAVVQSRQSFLDLLNELALAAADVIQATGIPPQLLLASDVSPAVRSPASGSAPVTEDRPTP